MATRVRLGLLLQRRLPQMYRRSGADCDVLAEHGTGSGRAYFCLQPLLDREPRWRRLPGSGIRQTRRCFPRAQPVAAVMPRRCRYERMWLRRMLDVGPLDGVGGVEVGEEGERVVSVPSQGPDTVVMDLSQG